MVSRTGYTGELGYEIWCHPDQAEELWDAVWSAGQAFNIAPMGFAALTRVRVAPEYAAAETPIGSG